jgi:hypothetical protein
MVLLKNVLVAIINSGKVRINFTLTNDFQDIKNMCIFALLFIKS